MFMILGYIGNICMLNGPKSSTNRAMQEAIASVLVAALVVGTGAGMFEFFICFEFNFQ